MLSDKQIDALMGDAKRTSDPGRNPMRSATPLRRPMQRNLPAIHNAAPMPIELPCSLLSRADGSGGQGQFDCRYLARLVIN